MSPLSAAATGSREYTVSDGTRDALTTDSTYQPGGARFEFGGDHAPV